MSSDLCVTQCGDHPNKHMPPHGVGGGGGVDGSVVGKLHGFALLWAGNGSVV